MQSAFIVSDRDSKPYAVIGLLAGGTEFYPITESAKNWSGWMKDEFAGKKITKEQLVVTLDNSMTIEGPVAYSRASKARIDELIKKAKKPADVAPVEAEKMSEKSDNIVEVLYLSDIHIADIQNNEYRNVVNFKAASFIADANRHTFAYEVKRTRATWDPSLRIPGTERSGGWRCPVGTRNGGQITDRFGRNCGWGVARRLANEISDLGERLEGGLDKRRERRVERRNARMMRQLQNQPGAIERGAGRLAEVLEGGQGQQPAARPQRQRRGQGVIERAARRVGQALEGDNNQQGQQAQRPAPQGRPRAPQAPARPRPQPRAPRPQPQARRPRPAQQNDAYANRLRDMDDDVLEREWLNANRAGNQQRLDKVNAELERRGMRPPIGDRNAPAPRRRPAQPRQAPAAPRDTVSNTPVPAGAPRPNESLNDYKRRKYNEHQANVRRIREGGGNAGFLRYEEWEQFHGPVVEDNWRRAQPTDRQETPEAPQAPKPSGRGARNTASSARVKPAATRRPTPEDVPQPQQPPRRERRPFNAPNQRGLGNVLAAQRKRVAMRADNPDKDYKIVKYNNKYYVVDNAEIQRANARGRNLEVVAEPPQPPRRPNATAAPTPPAAPPTPPSRPRGSARGLNLDELAQNPNLAPNNPRRGEQKMGHKIINGIMIPEHVGKPNAGIQDENDAIQFVRDGGALDDVPDEFLKKAIWENASMPGQPQNGKRFKLDGDPGDGINNRNQPDPYNRTYKVTDTVTNKQYMLKTPSFQQNEHIGEQLGAFVGQVVGRPTMARVRIAGKVEEVEWVDPSPFGRGRGKNNNAPLLIEHFADIMPSDVSIGDGYQVPAGARNGEASQIVKAIDRLLGNGDRHPGNYLWGKGFGRGNEKIPIDHGILNGAAGRGGNNRVAPSLSASGVANFKRDFPIATRAIKRFTAEQIDEMVDALEEHWSKANPDGLADNARQNARVIRASLKAIIAA